MSSTFENHEEKAYLKLLHEIMSKRMFRNDRTNTGTYAVFGRSLRFSLASNILPVITTKFVNINSILVELLWFISGSTDAHKLQKEGVHIWDLNSSRKYLDDHNLNNYEVGDIGPGYGFQWRHWGAEYKGKSVNYTGQGIDQLNNIINGLKTDKYSRRHILNSWNVSDLSKMALPPCHCMAQFLVNNNNQLTCVLTQRSADMGLGVPYNITSYALLTHLIAHVTGLTAEELVMNFGDCHVYENHVDRLQIQLGRTPKPFPTIKIDCPTDNIDAIKINDVKIYNYTSEKHIKLPMAV